MNQDSLRPIYSLTFADSATDGQLYVGFKQPWSDYPDLPESVHHTCEFKTGSDIGWCRFEDVLKCNQRLKDHLLTARQQYYFCKPASNINVLSDAICVGIPTYNGAKTIKKTLTSIIDSLRSLPSTIRKNVIICLDNCSDNTETIVREFVELNDIPDIPFTIIYNPNRKGKAACLNTIFANTDSHLLCWIDDDVVLEKDCISALVHELMASPQLRFVFARWIRSPLTASSRWRRFWHFVLGVKFDIQPYDRPSEFMRGGCMLSRRSSFVRLPEAILNDDQFLQYVYWPATKEVDKAVIYFTSVSSISDYYKRFIRITTGIRQLDDEFSTSRISECVGVLNRPIDYSRIWRLPIKQQTPFLFYRFIRVFISIAVKLRLKFNPQYDWFRIRHN